MKRLRDRQLTRSRVLLFVVGMALTVVGSVGLLLTADRVTQVTNWFDRRAPLLNSSLDQSLAEHRSTYQLIALAVAIVCIVVGAWWLRSQIPPIRHHQDNELPNAADVAGRNVVAGGALAAAMEDDLERHPEIDRARIELRPDDKLIRIRVSTADTLAVPELVHTAIDPATQRVVTVGELTGDLEVLTDVRFLPEHRQLA